MVFLRQAEHVCRRLRAIATQVAGWPVWALPAQLSGYLVGVTVLAASLTVVALLSMPWRLSQLLTFAGLLICGIVAIETTRRVSEVHGGARNARGNQTRTTRKDYQQNTRTGTGAARRNSTTDYSAEEPGPAS